MLPLGLRLQFDPTADPVFECRGCAAQYRNSCISIIRCLQRYGMIMVDGGGAVFYAEDRTKKTPRWQDAALQAAGYALPTNGVAALNGVDWASNLRCIEPVGGTQTGPS